MSDRFADLSKISFDEYETIGNYAFNFFAPLNSKQYKKDHGLPTDGPITPLSGYQFFSFLQEIDKKFDAKIHKVKRILSMMEYAGILTNEGHSNNIFLGNHYYTLKELTNLQKRNLLWLGEAFGLSYLQYKLSPNVIHITGEDDRQIPGNGTGFLINNKTVLTCKHVIKDMHPSEVLSIMGENYKYSTAINDSKDIAVLTLDRPVNGIFNFPAFNTATTLDEVLIMGFPPIPCADDAYMLSQRGEVNSIVRDYINKTTNIVLSSVTRPGNSGGPVISKDGYLIGMVTQFTVKGETTGSTKERKPDYSFPFYMAMDGKDLYDGIKEIDSEVEVFFEDYQ